MPGNKDEQSEKRLQAPAPSTLDELPPIPPRRRLMDRSETGVSTTPHPDHTGDASTESSGIRHKQSWAEDDGQEKNGDLSCNNTTKTGSSPEAALWSRSLADSMSTHGEARSLFTAPKGPSPASPATTVATEASFHLPPLQGAGLVGHEALKPLAVDEGYTSSFDLLEPAQNCKVRGPKFSIQALSDLLFSVEHLRVIFGHPEYLQRLTEFIYTQRPASVPLLQYYMDSAKALKAIGYANAITRELAAVSKVPSTALHVPEARNEALASRANEALEQLAREELRAYVSHVWAWFASTTMKWRITNKLGPFLRVLSEGADAFCLTDPSRPDNPVMFASEDWHRTCQYGPIDALGRNCRFLQGPKTDRDSVRRLGERLAEGKEHCEVLLNYRRDGSTFMNLVTVAPLHDNQGHIRYHLGAMVDVSGLAEGCAGLESLEDLLIQRVGEGTTSEPDEHKAVRSSTEALVNMTKTFTADERKVIETVSGDFGGSSIASQDTSSRTSLSGDNNTNGNNHETQQQKQQPATGETEGDRARLTRENTTHNAKGGYNYISSKSPPPAGRSASALATSVSTSITSSFFRQDSPSSSRRQGTLEHYVLVRPYPSLRILFASPSLRVPGILQSCLLHRIGGTMCDREVLAEEFHQDRGVTARIRWLTRSVVNLDSNPDSHSHSRGRNRWIHTTPLYGLNGAVGVWMVILMDDDDHDHDHDHDAATDARKGNQNGNSNGMGGRSASHNPDPVPEVEGETGAEAEETEEAEEAKTEAGGHSGAGAAVKQVVPPACPAPGLETGSACE